MKRHIYEYMQRTGRMKRRDVLKGMGATGGLAAFSGVATGTSVRPAWAGGHDDHPICQQHGFFEVVGDEAGASHECRRLAFNFERGWRCLSGLYSRAGRKEKRR